MESMPLVQVMTAPTIDVEQLGAASDFLVNGRVLAADPGGPVTYDTLRLTCESAEGTPAEGGTCDRAISFETVVITISADDVTPLASPNSPSPAGEVRLVVAVAVSTEPGAEDAAARLAESVPVGELMTAFIVAAPQGHLEMSQPNAWALTTESGDVIAATPDRPRWPATQAELERIAQGG